MCRIREIEFLLGHEDTHGCRVPGLRIDFHEVLVIGLPFDELSLRLRLLGGVSGARGSPDTIGRRLCAEFVRNEVLYCNIGDL